MVLLSINVRPSKYEPIIISSGANCSFIWLSVFSSGIVSAVIFLSFETKKNKINITLIIPIIFLGLISLKNSLSSIKNPVFVSFYC